MTDAAPDYSLCFWQGEKVRLRPLRLEDAEQGFKNSLDSSARQFLQLGIELPTTVDILTVSMEKYAGCRDVDGVIVFVVENLHDVNIGSISLHSRDPKNGTFSFGVIIDRAHRGQAYAKDAVRILLRYGFWERRFQKCNSACAHTNLASIKLHKNLGFLEEGRRRRQLFFNGEYYDDVLFGMTREEFDALERPGDSDPGGR